MNTSGIDPIEYKVLIRPQKAAEKVGSVYLPETVQEKDQHAIMEGIVIAVSPHAFTYEEWPETATPPRTGDTVVFARYSGVNIRGNDAQEYRLMNDKDIMAIRRAQ